jgi:hypothetical protein
VSRTRDFACGSAEFAGLVDIDRELARHVLSVDRKALDVRTAPRLAVLHRRDTPFGIPFCGIAPNALDQRQRIVDIDADDDFWLGFRFLQA